MSLYKTDEFKIISLNDEANKLTMKVKIDKEVAVKAFNEFVEREVIEESRIFEVVWE